ncbi:MAG: hypothetical protein AVDCRST_MAG69-2812 [uncultured Solirubrobacteraceae bacterium]|uniref:Uncharacterized protein n=1 Tax=uncultured Solirubrobacteraceae bacterium TaxID=1162706 RepID=A0A6J4T989_9ACTN|nr:MAG: hypothetical protein AVDCRST_MAG69-2812 [uncultured Solirubrobacteraceae bacterium]
MRQHPPRRAGSGRAASEPPVDAGRRSGESYRSRERTPWGAWLA